MRDRPCVPNTPSPGVKIPAAAQWSPLGPPRVPDFWPHTRSSLLHPLTSHSLCSWVFFLSNLCSLLCALPSWFHFLSSPLLLCPDPCRCVRVCIVMLRCTCAHIGQIRRLPNLVPLLWSFSPPTPELPFLPHFPPLPTHSFCLELLYLVLQHHSP